MSTLIICNLLIKCNEKFNIAHGISVVINRFVQHYIEKY